MRWLLKMFLVIMAASATGDGRLQSMADERPDQLQPVQLKPADSQTTEFVRRIVLLVLPETFDDEKNWGAEKRIQSGLHMNMDGLELKTRRKWHHVNHGSWQRASGHLVDPRNQLKLQLSQAATGDSGLTVYELVVSARVFGTGQQQQWNRGVRLWSVSADAEADLTFRCHFEVRRIVETKTSGTTLRFEPRVTQAEIQLDRFQLRRVSHMKGAAVREVGSWFEGMIRDRIRRENAKIVEKINRKLAEESSDFEIPFWFGKMQKEGNSRD